jgi:hypothetical protein
MPNFRLGADPEAFLQDRTGKILSAIGRIEGDKENPVQVTTFPKGFCYQADNVLVEYNIPPANNAKEFIYNNDKMMAFLNKKMMNEHKCQLAIRASHVMESDQLEDPRALVFGCEPDFNVWTLENNPRPKASDPALRSAGGHIHIGLEMSRMDKIMVGRLLDATVGLWSVQIDPDKQRRLLYGKAGAIRFKPYGLEYRTLSNFWLSSRDHMANVYQYVETALNLWRNKDYVFVDRHGKDIQAAINNSDVNLAGNIRSY